MRIPWHCALGLTTDRTFAALHAMNRSRASNWRVSLRWFLCCLLLAFSPHAVGQKSLIQVTTATEPLAHEVEEPVDAGSPRATVAEYLRLCRSGNYAEAGRYLDVPVSQAGRAPILARRLKAVIDRHVWLDLERISPLGPGDVNDGLPAAYDAIAKLPADVGQSESIWVFRRAATGALPAWVFSRTTVKHIDEWYAELPQRWMLEHLPAWLLRSGPKELLVWQWIALPCLFLMAWGLGWLLGNLTRRLISRLALRASASWDAELPRRLRGPLTLIWALSLVYAALPLLGLYQPAEAFVRQLVRGGYYFVLFWGLSRVIEAWGKVIANSVWANERHSAKSLVPIGVRLAKILLLVIAVVYLVSAMGYPAASIVAGLGVGGLAVALAAQKTVENLFGAFTLGADQPFRVGDFVKVEDFQGTVETIGLRSTRIRTLDRTVITIPNGRLSEMRLECYAARDRIRLACNLYLDYATTVEQLREVLAGCEKILLEHSLVFADNVTVRLKELGESALVIEVQAWFLTSDFAQFQRIREEVLLAFMTVVKRAGTRFSVPTRAVCQVSEGVMAQTGRS